MKRKLAKLYAKVKPVLLAISMYLIMPMQVWATTTEPKIVTGTRTLLAVVIGIITGFIVSLITISALKVGAKWTSASPEEKPKYQKELFNTIVAGVVTLTIGGTITWIVGFYQ